MSGTISTTATNTLISLCHVASPPLKLLIYVSPSADRVGDDVGLLLSVSASSGFYRAGRGHPSKHEMLTQCWVNVGPFYMTLIQH